MRCVGTFYGTAHCPKGPYLPRLLSAYAELVGGRAWSKTPKTRRDKGVARSIKDNGEVKTESAFLRKREAEIRILEHAKSRWRDPEKKFWAQTYHVTVELSSRRP